jgi:hypothetical protein
MKRLVLGTALVSLMALTACGDDSEAVVDNTKVTTGASQGDCGPDLAEPQVGNTHVEPGTDLDYEGVPPVSGDHWSQWPDIVKLVYAAEERPQLEELVHSQEHGWTMVWYDETVLAEPGADLESLAEQLDDEGVDKLVFVPWTSDDGEPFPAGKHVALTHWGTEGDGTEWRQFCAAPDVDAIKDFAERHPRTTSPEPNAP